MKLTVIGTGSSGNCYLLQQGDDALLLDAGLRWKDILKGLPYGIKGIKACLITHEHQDHCKAVRDVMRYGIKTVMSRGTAQEIFGNADLTQFNGLIEAHAAYAISLSPFLVVPVKILHDASEPLGFLIRHIGTGETAMYITDTYALPNKYPGINYWIVECNYIRQKAEELLKDPRKSVLYKRLTKSHMSLDRLVGSLMVNDLQHTRTIVLIHISNERGDSDLMQKTVEEATKVRTVSAVNGMKIELGTSPF